MYCIEHDLSQLAAIEAYELGSLKFASPVFLMAPTVMATELVPKGVKGTRIFFSHESAKCTDKTSVNVCGYTHEVTLDWEMIANNEDLLSLLITLQNTPHEFVLRYFGGVRKVIRTDRTSYRFTFNDDNGTMKCSTTLVNGQGLTFVKN